MVLSAQEKGHSESGKCLLKDTICLERTNTVNVQTPTDPQINVWIWLSIDDKLTDLGHIVIMLSIVVVNRKIRARIIIDSSI